MPLTDKASASIHALGCIYNCLVAKRSMTRPAHPPTGTIKCKEQQKTKLTNLPTMPMLMAEQLNEMTMIIGMITADES